MRIKFLLATVFALVQFSLFAQQGHEIQVTVKPFKNQYVYLGHYLGKQLPIIDSVMLNNESTGIFKGNARLGGGVYFIGFPDRASKFDILIDDQQQFSVIADTANLSNIQFVNSPENEAFKAYQLFMNRNGQAMENLAQQKEGKKGKDSVLLVQQIDSISNLVADYRMNIIQQDPGALLALLLTAMKEPQVPSPSEAAKADSLYAYKYFKNHFWDGVNFWDARVSRTPFFESRLDKYFEQLVYPKADSVIKEIDWMLGYASANADMQKFLLLKFVNRYLNQKYMWEDAVFVHLFEKYFSQKNYPWLTDQGRKIITDRAYSLMANITGTPAADINLPDSSGNFKNLFSVVAPHTVLVYYDPTCGHCKETLPKLDSMYRNKWKANGVKVYAVAKETSGNRTDWLNFVNQFQLKDWQHVYYSREAELARINANTPSYSQLYDVHTFPTLYLLDNEKRIVAKKVTAKQLDEILEERFRSGKK